jgi:Xaa-Pro aminopeptidase
VTPATGHTERLAAAVAEAELDLLIVGDLVTPADSSREAQANVFWASGFTGTSGFCLIGPERRLFLTDFRYAERAATEVGDEFERALFEGELAQELGSRLEGRVGFDDAHTSVAGHRKLAEAAGEGVELVASGGIVERLRRHKDAAELERIAEAARLADEVYEWVLERGVSGRSEREIQLAAEQRMRELGASAPAFPVIVAGGPSSAVPHHESGDREVSSGELLLIDMGAIVDGYCSDCTRTFAVGERDSEAEEVYELVRRAQETALEAIAPGVSGRDADTAAREVIEAAGRGDEFGHGLGHGVGIEVHEAPRASKRSDDVLAEGDVVTVEPGVYVPGRFGVRIEDLVALGDGGVRNLSGLDKELRTVE